MDQPLGPRLLRLSGDVQGSLSVDPLECRAALLDVVADGIDDRGRSFHRLCNSGLVPYIGVHELDPAVPFEPLEEGCAVGMAYAHTHIVSRLGQVFDDLAAQEPRSPEYRHQFGRHRLDTRFPVQETA